MQDPEISELAIYNSVRDEACKLGGKRYFPQALRAELKQLDLPPIPKGASLDHLAGSLDKFIEALEEKHLPVIQAELNLRGQSLNECKTRLKSYHSTLFERVKNKTAYLGTPKSGTSELEKFYLDIEKYLLHLDVFFSKEENQLPNALIERLQLLQTQSACGARFQAEAEQLFSMNCIPADSMTLDKQIALIASSEAKKNIESMVPGGDVHGINVLQWQLDSYLVGEKVARDHLGREREKLLLMQEFLGKHTSKNLVAQLQTALKPSSSLEELFTQYIEENMTATIHVDEQDIQQQAEEAWEAKVEDIRLKFQHYLEAQKGEGQYKSLKNNPQKLANVLMLSEQQIQCSDVLEFNDLLKESKGASTKQSIHNIRTGYISDKLHEQYYDSSKDRWGETIIAMMLEKMGVLMSHGS